MRKKKRGNENGGMGSCFRKLCFVRMEMDIFPERCIFMKPVNTKINNLKKKQHLYKVINALKG